MYVTYMYIYIYIGHGVSSYLFLLLTFVSFAVRRNNHFRIMYRGFPKNVCIPLCSFVFIFFRDRKSVHFSM